MKCPKCEREMRKGYLRSTYQPVQWIPEGSKPSPWISGVAKDAVVFGRESSWKDYRAEACYCDACKMVVISDE